MTMTSWRLRCHILLLRDLFGLILNDGPGSSLCVLNSMVVVLVSCNKMQLLLHHESDEEYGFKSFGSRKSITDILYVSYVLRTLKLVSIVKHSSIYTQHAGTCTSY